MARIALLTIVCLYSSLLGACLRDDGDEGDDSVREDSSSELDPGSGCSDEDAAAEGGDALPRPRTAAGAPTGRTLAWVNSGEDKVTQGELRMARSATAVTNSVWDGVRVHLFGARNEVVAFNLILESEGGAERLRVSFDELLGPDGFRIASKPVADEDVFDWVQRPIELFYVRYLTIRGLSRISYDTYDERHIPRRLQRPWQEEGEGVGGWTDRPDHDRAYPDIAVPLELVEAFNIEAGRNQSVWVDIYVPKQAPAGVYVGTLRVTDGDGERRIPVELDVLDFSLPDETTARTMVYIGHDDIVARYLGECAGPGDTERLNGIRDRHFQLAHRHRVSLIDDNTGLTDWDQAAPRPEWQRRLSGELFTPAHGYDGPGAGVSNGVFAIGSYGNWDWAEGGTATMHARSDAWVRWFDQYFPDVDYFLYLTDEPEEEDAFRQIRRWTQQLSANTGPGRRLRTLVTVSALEARRQALSVDIVASWLTIGRPDAWQEAVARQHQPGRAFYLYNAFRPHSGTFATEDDGVALRQLAWTQFKHRIDRWFFWEGTYYTNYQAGEGAVNVFQRAHTFGEDEEFDSELGRTGWNYSNGDGVLFYPGTDRVFPEESYGVAGPFASLRLKHWRRGLQDVEYLALAAQLDPDAVHRLVSRMIPTTLWEYGVGDPDDPTWVLAAPSWSDNSEDWEAARRTLAEIITGATPGMN